MDTPFMRRAIELARQAFGVSSPNPAVGAVLVKDGRVVGEGSTQQPGQAHAEIVALRQAGEAARGAALYVTLEPCPHQGRTAPCTEALLRAGVAEVYMGAMDPNPPVRGKGKQRLEEAGVATHWEGPSDPLIELNVPYFKYIHSGLPFLTAKYAMTLDGKIATRTGDSRWISGEDSRALVHDLRAHSDAIMVGIQTLLHDDPQLTARDSEGNAGPRQPLRVVVDSQGRTPRSARVFQQPGRTLIAVASEQARQRLAWAPEARAEVVSLSGGDGRVDLKALLALLGERGIVHLLVEGGGVLLGALMDQDLVDRVMAFVAPIIAGGQAAPTPVAGQGVEVMAQAHRLQQVRLQEVGQDVLVTGYLGQAAGLCGQALGGP